MGQQSNLNPSSKGLSNAECVRSFLGSFARRDPETIAAHVAEGFINEHMTVLGRGCVGRSVYLERLPAFLDDMKDLVYEIEDLVVEGDRLFVSYRLHALWKDEATISMQGVMRFEMAEGLIAKRTDYWDSSSFLNQI